MRLTNPPYAGSVGGAGTGFVIFYDVEKYIHGSATKSGSSNLTPLTLKELKVDKIVISWIFTTLSDTLQARLVVARPKSAKEAWGIISDIVKDNKMSRTNALKAKLCSIKLGDQSMESYFQKIESIATILTSLDSHVNDEDFVHYALEGLPNKYDQVCGYVHRKDTFPDLKTGRSMLITEEMRLKSKALASPVDSLSSSPMVLLAKSGNNHLPSTTPQVKSWRPCFNFAKGACRFGDSCRYVHDGNVRMGTTNNSPTVAFHTSPSTNTSPPAGPITIYPSSFSLPTHVPSYHFAAAMSPAQAQYVQPTQLVQSAQHSLPAQYVQPTTISGSVAQPIAAPIQPENIGPTTVSGPTTTLPHAFNAETLQDPNGGA
ncbi:ribonuclease H-like domain-containing protein [Tanacetum coccineum]